MIEDIEDIDKYKIIFSDNGDKTYIEYIKKIACDYHINCYFTNINPSQYDLLIFANNNDEFEYNFLTSIVSEKQIPIIVNNTRIYEELICQAKCEGYNLRIRLCDIKNQIALTKEIYENMLIINDFSSEYNRNVEYYKKYYTIDEHINNLSKIVHYL